MAYGEKALGCEKVILENVMLQFPPIIMLPFALCKMHIGIYSVIIFVHQILLTTKSVLEKNDVKSKITV